MKRSDVDLEKVTPMMRQYLDVKSNNEDVIIFFRLGDFYEIFFEYAIKVSHELKLTLTGKNAGLDEKIPMCGIPHHAANIYIEKLIEKGYKIGICEQLEDPKLAKGIVKRDIIQIISRGTLIDNESLNEKENNYIGNIMDFNHAYAISYSDISTGVIYVSLYPHNQTQLITQIVSLGIKEIIMSDKMDKNIYSLLKNQFHITVSISDDIEEFDNYKYIYEDITDIRLKENKNYLKMDIHTKRNLELTETLRTKERNYSLIWLLDKTKTAMGSRMLKYMIENPLIDKNQINKRYDTIDTLLKEFILKDDLSKLLFEVYDLERLSGRVAFGNCNAKDLLQLKNSLKVLPDIKEILTKINFYKNIEPLNDLYELLEGVIYEN